MSALARSERFLASESFGLPGVKVGISALPGIAELGRAKGNGHALREIQRLTRRIPEPEGSIWFLWTASDRDQNPATSRIASRI